MTLAMHFLCRSLRIKAIREIGLNVVILILLSTGSLLVADAANPPPDFSSTASAGQEDFGQYLVDHQADLAPFFEKNLEELVRKAMPMVLGMLAWILMFTLIASWVVDIGLIRTFTPFFAPAYSKLQRAVIFSTGRLVLSFLIMGLMALTVFLSMRFVHAGIINLIVAGILLVLGGAAQIWWLSYLFRMNVGSAIIFFVIIAGAQAITFIVVAAPVLTGAPSTLAYRFVNETLTPQLQTEVDATNQELAAIVQARDATKAKIADLQNQVAQDQAGQEKLALEIENKKNSEQFLFQQIAKIEATGDLATAHDKFTAMLAKYPTGALADTVKAHLAQIESELAVQEAKKKKDDADAAAAAAAARVDLLARAAKGEVTLSEMRKVLVGKSRSDVTSLFGPPTDTASNRWGYGQQMILNPMTQEKHGLTVYFDEETVQGVDYYYGVAK